MEVPGMGRKLLVLVFMLYSLTFSVALIEPVSDTHRSAAVELFDVKEDGSFGSLEETYRAVRSFQVLGIDVKDSVGACQLGLEALRSSFSDTKGISYALRIGEILKCSLDDPDLLKGIVSKLQSLVRDATSLLDFYYPITSLVALKNWEQAFETGIVLKDSNNIFNLIKTLSQSDGTWRYASNEGESSPSAAGLAFEVLAGVVTLADAEIEHSNIEQVKNAIIKLFESLESYEDGSFYFEEKKVDAISASGGSLSATSSVIRGVTAFAAVIPEKLKIPGDRFVGIANFFLSMGVPGSSSELYHQLDALGNFDNNRVIIPVVLSLPATVLSISSGDRLEVLLRTALGSTTPPMTVSLIHAAKSGSSDAPIVYDQKLEPSTENSAYMLEFLSKGIDVGKYDLTFEVLPLDGEHAKTYSTGGRVQVLVTVSGIIKIENAEIAVLDSDTGSAETLKKLDPLKEEVLSLSANHLQKLHLSFQMTSPLGHLFKPHQVFLKLTHESKLEHIFVPSFSGTTFELTLDFLGLVEKLYYLTGAYHIELAVGDSTMENSFLRVLGSLQLDLPDPPEGAAHPPAAVPDPMSRFAPKSEITHIFRTPERLPPAQLSYAFLALTLLPMLGFLIGLWRLGANLKHFPLSCLPMISALSFHGGLLSVLGLYLLFWIKLNLFTTLKYLGFLGVFLLVAGHCILSHLSNLSSKVKTN